MKLFFEVNLEKSNAAGCANKAIEFLENQGVECYINSNLKGRLSENKFKYMDVGQLDEIDIVIAVGGDGTIMHIGKQAALHDVPVLGINAGRLGFMAGLEMCELSLLSNLVTGEYTEQPRMMLEMEHFNSGGESKTYVAVNDFLITKAELTNIIDIDVFCGDKIVNKYRSDAVLFSTPTGSTSYSLSNGGPIADPILSYISMSPICPHSFASRTYLFHKDTVLTAKCSQSNRNKAYLVADGNVISRLEEHDRVDIKASKHKMRLIMINNRSFYEVVSEKFVVN